MSSANTPPASKKPAAKKATARKAPTVVAPAEVVEAEVVEAEVVEAEVVEAEVVEVVIDDVTPTTISEVIEAEKAAVEIVQAPEVANINLPAATVSLEAIGLSEESMRKVLSGENEVVTSDYALGADSFEADRIDTGQLPTRRERASGEPSNIPEPVSMLTPERVLDAKKVRDAPTEGWNKFVYNATFHQVNLGDSPVTRHRKMLDASISRQLDGGTRFIPVLTRKGGVGKTSVTSMLGMALARTREDRVVAIDANPDRGTLVERFNKTSDETVRDLVAKAHTISSFNEFGTFVTRDKTRLDVLASDTDPHLSEAFGENDYNVVAEMVSRYYTLALTDCGTGIVHSVMRATLQHADELVIVSGGSFDEARLAAETLTWLETNGYTDLVRNSIVAINTATQGTSLVKLKEIEQHFQSRVRETVRIPYDPMLAAGSVIDFDKLKPATQEAARQLAALVVDGLPSKS
jgi:MinD-like ATPase involved in chromosome partitioning or flagellar assembly